MNKLNKIDELIIKILESMKDEEIECFFENINFYSLRASDLNKISEKEKKENEKLIREKEIEYLLKSNISYHFKALLIKAKRDE